MNKKTPLEEQYEYYKRENDAVKWTALLLFGVPLLTIFAIFVAAIIGSQ